MSSDRCDKCDKINLITHFIFNPATGQTDEVFVSRKTTGEELVFCSLSHCQEYCKSCDECFGYCGKNNFSNAKENDGKIFCSKDCVFKYYAPLCPQCLTEKSKSDSLCCSERCKIIYYTPICDACSQKCLKYDGNIPEENAYYKDIKTRTGTLCKTCWVKEHPKPEDDNPIKLSEIEQLQTEIDKDKKELAELRKKTNRLSLEDKQIELLEQGIKLKEDRLKFLLEYKRKQEPNETNNFPNKNYVIAMIFILVGIGFFIRKLQKSKKKQQ